MSELVGRRGAGAVVVAALCLLLAAGRVSLRQEARAGSLLAVNRVMRQARGVREARGAAPQQRRTQLWVQPDNGVMTTINVRGMADPQGGIQYNSNFVYGAPGVPQAQPDAVSDQSWRYQEDGGYKTLTGPTTGGSTPNYGIINVGPMESDGSEWGYVPSQATPVYDFFPSNMYPSSSAYNWPASVPTDAAGKEAYVVSNGQGTGVVHSDGSVGGSHPANSYGPGLTWGVDYDYGTG